MHHVRAIAGKQIVTESILNLLTQQNGSFWQCK